MIRFPEPGDVLLVRWTGAMVVLRAVRREFDKTTTVTGERDGCVYQINVSDEDFRVRRAKLWRSAK